jgi:molybdopterin-guanine dinucleotide biosynthesis protein A
MARKDSSAIVLAGGSGKRLRGQDKSLVEVLGTPMLRRVLDAVERVCDEVVVSVEGVEQRARIEKLLGNAIVVHDILEDFGPLEGIRQACRAVTRPLAVVVACDQPLLNAAFIGYLFSRIGSFDGVIPRWPDGNVEPLCSAFRTSALAKAVDEAVSMDVRRIMYALRPLKIRYVSTDELDNIDPGLYSLINVNDEHDLRRARIMASRKDRS